MGRLSPWGPATMKNWLPPVLGCPVLAMATEPERVLLGGVGRLGRELVGNGVARARRCRCRVGSPVWSMKPGMTRWKITQW